MLKLLFGKSGLYATAIGGAWIVAK